MMPSLYSPTLGMPPHDNVRRHEGIDAEVYTRNDEPIAIVLRKHATARPVLCLKESPLDHHLVDFPFLGQNGIPDFDRRVVHANVNVEVRELDGTPVAVACWDDEEDEPFFAYANPTSVDCASVADNAASMHCPAPPPDTSDDSPSP
jgi:hypothetical protein